MMFDYRRQSCSATAIVLLRRLPGKAMTQGAAALALLCCLHGALAQDQIKDWSAQNVPGSIQSIEAADEVLGAIEGERQNIERNYAVEQHACYDKFFVSSCLSRAAERRRLALQQIRPAEIEANVYKRRAKVEERDKNLAEQKLRDQQEAAQRAQQQRDREISTAAKVEHNAREAQAATANSRAHAGEAQKREAEHAARLQKNQAEEAANAGERAKNIADFEKKRQEAEARQREIAAKKAEKQRKNAAKTDPSTPAATPSKP
jgi:colicin import membrane protein